MPETQTQTENRPDRFSAGAPAGRRRRLDSGALLSRGIVYAALIVLAVAIYVLIVWGLNLLLTAAVPGDDPLVIGLMVVLLAVAFQPLRDRLLHAVDALFFRGRIMYQERLGEFSQDLTQVSGLEEILRLMRSYIVAGLRPDRLHIFLLDPLSDQFAGMPTGPDQSSSTDLRFAPDSALAAYLERAGAPVSLADGKPLPDELGPEKARLALLGAGLFVPLIGRKQLVGWLALSGRRSGEPYKRQDLAFLDTLSDQSAPAVERAQALAGLQQRVHEMNVLGRVAQGINVTLNFDDILELIFAQTTQVVPAQHFRITLYDSIADTFQHVFYLEDDDRLREQENQAIPPGLGLEQAVVRGQRAITTDDYDRECRRRSVIPSQKGIYAWAGVPLVAGTQTIGALCLGSRDAAVAYTPEQQSIIQSIADQAAGAIVKTQLLAESERRTHQLEALNQVARRLALELEIEPLISRILESAVDILRCAAGRLYLLDEDTGEIVISGVAGDAVDPIGTRLAPGSGLPGRCAETRRPVIRNKAGQNRKDGDRRAPARDLMVVPMQLRDEVSGVIEVIDKTDRSPFTPDDERLLMAFSAQAAVALQNARLFTMTDQALASRVDELSVMQRIDRELNAGLDQARAMTITLKWAIGQSGADAGLIAIVGEEDLVIMDSRGYPDDFNDSDRSGDLSRLDFVSAALEQAPARSVLPQTGRAAGLLPGSEDQAAIPILRENRPIALLVLESRAPAHFTPETTSFLNRLSDHAAIAIANARFYAEAQEANIAKSDFISFVSHELKTPMTSIKGYADLLSAGAVGEVNEAQAGFLATIRSNVNRMATLVSDLADISRIESGRLRLEYGPVAVREILDEVVRSARRQIEEKSQVLELEIPEMLAPVWGDRNRLVQVLANLISNANKYTPEGGVIRVAATQESGAAGTPNPGPFIQIAVHDSGIGIHPADQRRIFAKFFRSEDQKARESPGTGLGLNITKNLVEMQGGRIWFESRFREGSSFYVSIPVAETD